MTELAVICHTTGCPNEGVEVVMSIVVDDPEVPPPSIVVCGPCGQPTTDVTPV